MGMKLDSLSASLLVASGWLLSVGGTSAAEVNTYVEFLWSSPPKDAIARQQTRGFLLDGKHQHQVCVAVFDPALQPAVLRIEAIDAAGKMVSRRNYEDFTGVKRCYRAELPRHGEPGKWTFNIYLDGILAATDKIEVARKLETAIFHAPSMQPYVLGRPNYDAKIAPDEFVGRLIWVMHVDGKGAVTNVEVELAEGVGLLMKDRAIAAGYMSLFPPDRSRNAAATYRRELAFEPNKAE